MAFSLFVLISYLYSILFSSYYFLFIIFVFMALLLFSSPYYFSYSISLDFFFDEVSLFMNFMLLCVVFLSSFFVLRYHSISYLFSLLIAIVLVCSIVFSSSSLLYLYVSYEISLIPIILIIIIWGSYPERSLSSLMLLLYTSIFTIPFIFVMFYVYSYYSTFSFYSMDSQLSPFMSSILFCVFAVKLPIYGLHFWLPMAHVEAPTFGSMILAGVLLKLGGVSLIRCYLLVDWEFLAGYFLSYFFVFLLYVTVVCSFQSDFNRLVAYSSVSHMMVVPILLMSYTLVGSNAAVLVLLFHGFSSPLLFSLVGYIYSIFGTRQLILIRGIILCSPILSLVCILGFMFSLCVPPFPSYVSEVLFFISSVNMWYLAPVILVLFSFLSLIYNLNWLSSALFSTCSSSLSYSSFYYPYFYFFSMVMFVVVGFAFVVLFSFI